VDLQVLALQFGEDLSRAIVGTVVHANKLELPGIGENFPDHFAQSSALVINGHYNREFHSQSFEG
jgi:hypothetical protein